MSETEDTGEQSRLTKEDLLKPLSARKVRLKVNKFLMPASRADVTPHYFTGKQVQFLEAYSETLDYQEACKKSGLSLAGVKKCPYLVEEVKRINQAAMFKHRGKSALGNHHRLMEKFEREFDNKLASAEMKKASMSTLARMSEASMRAAGEFDDKGEDAGGVTGVRVVINIAAPESSEAKPTEGSVIDV